MATKRTAVKKSEKRDAPNIINFFNVNGITYALGDLRKADFSMLDDPKASVNSLREWAIQLNNILRGAVQDK